MTAKNYSPAFPSIGQCNTFSTLVCTEWWGFFILRITSCLIASSAILTQASYVSAANGAGIDAEEFPELESYIEAVKQKERSDAELDDMMMKHEQWRQNTLLGRTVVGLQYIARHPFWKSVFDITNNTDSSTMYGILLINLARIALLAIAFFAVYLLGCVIKLILGEEIVVEERVVIIDEVTKSGKKLRSTELSEESEFIAEQEKQQKPRRDKKSKKED